jgi:hypothetical protein
MRKEVQQLTGDLKAKKSALKGKYYFNCSEVSMQIIMIISAWFTINKKKSLLFNLDVQSKLDELGKASDLADMISKLKAENASLKSELSSKGASSSELDDGNFYFLSYI